MKVLLWPKNYFRYIGGLERLTHNLALSLTESGHQVLVVTDNPGKQTSLEDTVDGINVVRLPFSYALLQKDLPLIKTTLQAISTIIHQFDPDILNSHGWHETMCFYQARMIDTTNKPHCLTIHGLLEQPHYQSNLCRRVWHSSQAISTVSYAMQAELIKACAQHANLRVIHNGTLQSVEDTQQTRKEIEATALTAKLLCIGRLSPEKGFDVMLHAFKHLLFAHPDAELTIVGDGPLYDDLWALANNLEVASQTKLLGPVPPDEIDAFIDEATLLVVPSTYESFGLVALEAAMRARAVVTSNVLGLREVVADGETGLLVPPTNPIALANAIESLLSDPATLHTMGQRARSRAERLFNLNLMTQRYLAMYDDCLT